MCRFVLSILVILILRAYAKELMNSVGNKPDLMHKVVDEPQRADKQADLDATTVGKHSHIAMSHQSLLPLQPQFSQPRPLFQNSLIPVQSSRLQSIWGRAKAAGKSSGSSGAMPQRESGGYHGRNHGHNCGSGPAALTAQIKKSTVIKELISTHHAHESRLNHKHLSACWITLNRLASRPTERQ